MTQLEGLMKEHFVEYASYFILDRAIPDIRDGLKPVQRRILHTLFQMNDGRYHKVANVIGDTMKLHPHGDASIGDALVVLATKNFFIDRQGNFGNVVTGHPAAAPRYIECRLTPLALDTMFNEALTEFVPSYDGRNQEPVVLPAKLPVVLMLGTEGIAVGMATKLLPHNLVELLRAQIAILRGERFKLVPDFQQGGIMDVSAYDGGLGKVEVRAKLEARGDKKVVIREVPYGTTTESLVSSIEAAVQKGRVKISSIHDYTTDQVEIELSLARGATADEVIPQLFAYTDCSVSISSNPIVIRDRRPVQLKVGVILEALTAQLREQLKAELEWERDQLEDRRHWLTLEQIFVEKRVYKKIENQKSSDGVHKAVMTGMKAYQKLFVRPMIDDDVKRLLEVRIRRISAYDIEKNRKQIEEIEARIAEIGRRLRNMKKTTIDYLNGLLDKYGAQFPRRTKVAKIEAVDKKAVARASIRLYYDKKAGFLGSGVKGESLDLAVSEFDVVMAVGSNGSYRIMPPPDKQLVEGKLMHCARFDPDEGEEFVVVYRDAQRFCYAKRIKVEKFIRNKEYRFFKDPKGRLDLLLRPEEAGALDLEFVPMKRQRLKKASFDLAELEPTGVTARGTRLAPKPVSKIKHTPREGPPAAPVETPPEATEPTEAKASPAAKAPKKGTKAKKTAKAAGSKKTARTSKASARTSKAAKPSKKAGAKASKKSGGKTAKKSARRAKKSGRTGGKQGNLF